MAQGWVELEVYDEDKLQLRYAFATVGEACETMRFLRDFFPDGRFVIQPLRQ